MKPTLSFKSILLFPFRSIDDWLQRHALMTEIIGTIITAAGFIAGVILLITR